MTNKKIDHAIQRLHEQHPNLTWNDILAQHTITRISEAPRKTKKTVCGKGTAKIRMYKRYQQI